MAATKSSGRRGARARPCDDDHRWRCDSSPRPGPLLLRPASARGWQAFQPARCRRNHLLCFRDDATCRTSATARNRSSLGGLARSASARKCTLTAPSSSASRANTGTKGSSQAGGPALSIRPWPERQKIKCVPRDTFVIGPKAGALKAETDSTRAIAAEWAADICR